MRPQPPHEDDHLELDQLKEELHRLERRIDALEHWPAPRPAAAAPIITTPVISPESLLTGAPNALAAAGRAVLGLAGAFLLRALAESGAIPGLLVVLAAILYAVTWLVFSVRTREQDTFGSSLYGITAALILAPLLWEATLRFHVLPPMVAAAILPAFLLLSDALAWSRMSGAVIAVTTLATLVTALALMVQTGDLVPFALAILAIACVIEASACRGHARSMRIPAAVAADFAIWLIYFLMTRPSGMPEHYQPVSAGMSIALGTLLFAAYAVSIAWQCAILRRAIAVGEIIQMIVVFVLACGGALMIGPARSALFVGACCAVAGAGCYFTAFLRFAGTQIRNHHVFAAWGAALCLLGCALILSPREVTLLWSAAAVLTTLAGANASLATLRVHGLIYLIAAALVSGFPAVLLDAFTGTTVPHPSAAVLVIGVASACCLAAAFRSESAVLNLLPSLLAAGSLGAVLILAIRVIDGSPSASLLATARTVVICGLALTLGFLGSRAAHPELVWISYLAIALGTVKLVVEDFRHGNPAALAVSLVCYGAVLILTPKLTRRVV